jgi:hypothetical protein
MHGGDEPVESYTQELIEMLECSDPSHAGCREKGQALLDVLPRLAQARIHQIRERNERARRVDLEWERRRAAGMTVGGDQYNAMLDDLRRKYLPK